RVGESPLSGLQDVHDAGSSRPFTTIEGTRRMKSPPVDRRLIGTWKSDRRRTFRFYRHKRGCSQETLRAFQSLFGKLVVRWGRKRWTSDLGGFRSYGSYEVIARDGTSVVIRTTDSSTGDTRLQQLHFDGNHYWMPVGENGILIEHFRRMKP